ncbi:MAG: precorrin-6A reductase [Butyrivibrio sp.]|nr:precorrin-6A reductase [Butyrivibrio sp.]
MKSKVLIFGGTTEGRELAELLDRAMIPHAVSVATEYGEEIEENAGEKNLFVGRRNASEMADIMRDGGFGIVVDATHPFATGASEEIRKASKEAGVKYLRLSRDTASGSEYGEDVFDVLNLDEAAGKLMEIGGSVLVLTGSKELKNLTSKLGSNINIYARVLPNEDSLQKCKEAGLSGRQIIAMQGPFSKQMNIALIKETGVDAILTKESGQTGGFAEKLQAAKECGIKTVVIRNPESVSENSDGKSMSEIIREIEKETGALVRTITVAGMGPGDEKLFTVDFIRAIQGADIIFGAATVTASFRELTGTKTPTKDIYRGEEILEFLDEHTEYMRPLVIYSGDISLCSGAIKATEVFEKAGFRVERIPGISSVTLFAERLRIDLQNCSILSAHGKDANVTGHAMKNERLIALTSGYEHALEIADKLPENMKVVLGYELGSKDEEIIIIKDIAEKEASKCEMPDSNIKDYSGRCLLYIENPEAYTNTVYPAIGDDEFIRGKVPMTKEEIRSFSIRKLGLTAESILYDIGAGTGSVSIEAALTHPDINVYSIEKKPEAIELLNENRRKFHADNMEIIEGTAPDAMDGLPTPTHAFIGGSSGNMKEIIEKVRALNEKAKIVINCLTPQTLSEVMDIVATYEIITPEITQINATRFKKAGSYDLPDAQNPVYIISF